MSAVKITLDRASLKETQRALHKKSAEINALAEEGLQRIGLDILADAQRELKANDNIATSKLINSGVVRKVENGVIEVIFRADYAANIEQGQKAGTIVGINALMQWIKKKGILDLFSIRTHKRAKRGDDYERRLKGLAFAIRKTIQRRGTKAQPYLYPAFRKNQSRVTRILSNAIRKAL